MISVKEIKISNQFSMDSIYIEVMLNDTFEDLSKYKINLYRSNNDHDNFQIICEDMQDLRFVDYDVSMYNTYLKYYYKVGIAEEDGGENFSNVYMLEYNQPDNEAYYLAEITKIYLETAINNDVMILLSRKRSGSVCPECYDDIRKRPQISNCNICYGTNYVDGYYQPVPINVCYIGPKSINQDFSIFGVGDKEVPISLWTSNFPLIRTDDILVNKNNDRYIVTGWQPTYKNFCLIRQTISAMIIPRGNIAYDVPMDIRFYGGE